MTDVGEQRGGHILQDFFKVTLKLEVFSAVMFCAKHLQEFLHTNHVGRHLSDIWTALSWSDCLTGTLDKAGLNPAHKKKKKTPLLVKK